MIVLNHLRDADNVSAIAQRLLDSLGRPYTIGSHQLHCSVSIGIVRQAEAAGDADVVLAGCEHCDDGSEAGRWGLFRRVRTGDAGAGGAAGESRSRLCASAITHGELFVMYQPVVDLQRGEAAGGCAGVEALVRWRHPTRGVVPPFEFIGAAEECGLIAAIGEFVLDTACRQFVEWQYDARCARAAHAGGESVAGAARPARIHRCAAPRCSWAVGMAPAQLQLEVTESLAAQDKAVQARLHELKALGLTLALDDFGTGFSSLASLHQLPVDTVKIDRSFVMQADTSRHHHVLIQATVLVANSLGMSTVAEGIETEAQAAVVRQLGCDKGQGYLFSKPLLAADVVQWLSAERRHGESLPARALESSESPPKRA